ncbi:MAG: hypothetical protein ACK4TG_09480 [Thermaurantiacus sp.]
MRIGRTMREAGVATAALAALVLATPAVANQKPRTATASALSGTQPPRALVVEAEGPTFRLRPNTLASFTPATIDVGRFSFTAPGRASAAPVQSVERSFRFTPSGSSERRAVSLGMTARSVAPPAPSGTAARVAAAPVDRAVQPVGYNLDLSLGWNGFSLSGGVSRLDTGVVAGLREGVDLAVSYGGRNWKTSVQATAERSAPVVLRQFDDVERFGIEAGGAVAVGRSMSVLGGVRYRTAPENASLLDPNSDEKRVYIGGAFAF